jgi:1,4-dihydroxy-2-naphthoate octaprenyltransferase
LKKFKVWISAARLRTLPLSLSGIITGTALANFLGYRDSVIFGLCMLITAGFQITSNFANDYGDGVKGTDAEDRVGPKRALQSGSLTEKELKSGIGITILVSIFLTIGLLGYVFGREQLPYFAIFFVLGILSVWAAIKYTVGDSAYGYRGLGDVFVFIFFGLLAVLGTKFLYVQHINLVDLLPAVAIGFLCAGVLNLNNLRDIKSDTNHGKNTLVVKLGYNKGKTYHALLLVISFLCFVLYSILQLKRVWALLFLIPYLIIFIHLIKVMRNDEPAKLDPELKKLALSTFLLSLLFYFTVNYFL